METVWHFVPNCNPFMLKISFMVIIFTVQYVVLDIYGTYFTNLAV